MMALTFCFTNWQHTFWTNLVQKIKICQIKLTHGNKTNSDVLNLIAKLGFSIFYWKDFFEANFINKIKKCQFKLKFGKTTNSNILILIVKTINIFLGRVYHKK